MVIERLTQTGDRILAIGEAKSTKAPVDVGELERLTHLRSLLPSSRVSSQVKLLLFSRSGFTAELSQLAAHRSDVELIDLERLYFGD